MSTAKSPYIYWLIYCLIYTFQNTSLINFLTVTWKFPIFLILDDDKNIHIQSTF